jgi:multicomponent Na+:H+ antiporter subunit D
VLLTSSLLNAAYFLPITYNAFFEKGNGDESMKMQEAPIFTVAPLVFTALVSFLLFIYPTFFLELAKMTARSILGG